MIKCGYNTLASLQGIYSDSIARIENYINDYARDVVQGLNCCYHCEYKGQETFKFLPGHYDFLLIWPMYINNHSSRYAEESSEHCNLLQSINSHPGVSKIMKELIQTTLLNETVNKNNAQYSDIIRYFATYIFILCGRSCYEVLYKNLPLPSISTICE